MSENVMHNIQYKSVKTLLKNFKCFTVNHNKFPFPVFLLKYFFLSLKLCQTFLDTGLHDAETT